MKLDIQSAPFCLCAIHSFILYEIFSHKLINQMKAAGVTVTRTKRRTFGSKRNLVLMLLMEKKKPREPDPWCSPALISVSSPGAF